MLEVEGGLGLYICGLFYKAALAVHDAGHEEAALELATDLVALHQYIVDAEDPPSEQAREDLAQLLVNWPQRELQDLERASRLDPSRFGTPQLVANHFAVLGRYADAASQMEIAAESEPNDDGLALRLALLHFASDDRPGYDAICRQMIARFGSTDNPVAARRICFASALSPQPVGEIDELLRLAELALTNKGDLNLAARERGLVAYRAGAWESALKWCTHSRELDARSANMVRRSINLLIEAMANHRLDRRADAIACYDEVASIAPASIPDGDWLEWMYYQQLRREAEDLLRTNE
jgi:tetratricopeptide (TPR) repeat protein